jgi:hypothetical protein
LVSASAQDSFTHAFCFVQQVGDGAEHRMREADRHRGAR